MTLKWTLDEALSLIRLLQPETRKFGYHLCLGGGVLNVGFSEKDLDLYFLPMDNPEHPTDPDKLSGWLDTCWGKATDLFGDYPLTDSSGKPSMYIKKVKYDYSGMRIDVFILRTSIDKDSCSEGR